MMLLERRGISGAIELGSTDDVIEMVSSDITAVFNVVCDAKYAVEMAGMIGLKGEDISDSLIPDAFPLPMLTLANTEYSDDDKLFGGGDCSPSLVLSN